MLLQGRQSRDVHVTSILALWSRVITLFQGWSSIPAGNEQAEQAQRHACAYASRLKRTCAQGARSASGWQ